MRKNNYLKAESAAALRAALVAAGILAETPDGDHVADGCSLDVIGQIHKPTGEIIAVDGIDVPEMAPVPGWHANLLADLSDDQLAALGDVLLPVPPAAPYRIWAEVPAVVDPVEDQL